MSERPKTHQERAEAVASVLACPTHTYKHPETGEEKTAAELIARETYPTELVEAARELLDQVEADHAHLMGDHEGMPDSPEVVDLLRQARTALALYPEAP